MPNLMQLLNPIYTKFLILSILRVYILPLHNR